MIKTPYIALLIEYLLPVAYATLFYFVQIEPHDGSYLQVLLLLGGFYVGNILLWLDNRTFYNYYNELQTLPKQLITRSTLFILAYLVLTIFMVTSSGNLIGVGCVLGIGITLATEMWQTYKDSELFHKKFLFQVKRILSPLELQRVVWGFTGFVAVSGLYYLFSASH